MSHINQQCIFQDLFSTTEMKRPELWFVSDKSTKYLSNFIHQGPYWAFCTYTLIQEILTNLSKNSHFTGHQSRFKEAMWLAWGHKVIKWQSQDSNPGVVTTKPIQLKLYGNFFHSYLNSMNWSKQGQNSLNYLK